MNNPNTEVGYALSSRDFLVFLDGMPSVRINDLVQSERGLRGWVNALYPDKVEVLMLDEGIVSPGELFKRLPNRLSISLGQYLMGRIINPLGVPVDGRRINPQTKTEAVSELDTSAPGIQSRKFITDQFLTGITLVDTLIPLAKGQREMVLGDAHSGKTAFLIDLIVNQNDNPNTICIYASMGKPVTQLRNLIDVLKNNGAMSHTVIIASTSSESPPLIYLTPQTAFTIAEYFQKMGKDVLLILDDIGIHAKIYREISLLSGKSPGRESYPGDIFYQHAHLLERAGNFKPEAGGGSITALPVMELNLADFATYIPTNLIGMTDGHFMFKASLHSQGQIPAIDISLSVSRVGRQTQNRLHNLLAGSIKQLLAQAAELETISRFSSELPVETRLTLKRKSIIEELIRQDSLTDIPLEVQVVILGLTFTNMFLDKDLSFVQRNKVALISAFKKDPALKAFADKIFKLETMEDLIKSLEQAVPGLLKLCK